jgi:hypothetical protein
MMKMMVISYRKILNSKTIIISIFFTPIFKIYNFSQYPKLDKYISSPIFYFTSNKIKYIHLFPHSPRPILSNRGEMARKSLHKGVVIAVLLLNNLALLVLNGAELGEEMLKGGIHVDSALVAGILEIVVLDVRSNQLQCLLARNKEVLTVISQVINNQDTIIVVEALVVLKKGLHLSSVNGLELLKTLVAIGRAVLTALAALLVQALDITLELADIGGSGTGSLNKGLKKSLALAGKLNQGVSLGLEAADILGINTGINNSCRN